MKWRKLGLVCGPNKQNKQAVSHASLPTPIMLNDDVIRVFITCMDSQGRGRPTFVDVSSRNPMIVLNISPCALLDIGQPGTFDDNGLAAVSIVQISDEIMYMYYAGFELCHHIRYRIFTGLAVSNDSGKTFSKYSKKAILDRSADELFFRCGPYVMQDGGIFKLWYIAGSSWTSIDNKEVPVYDLRYQESKDGINWLDSGKLSLSIDDEDEHGFGRPWVVKRGKDDYQLFYSIRRKSLAAYRLGYAESSDGINWIRMDKKMGLDVTPDEFDSNAIMYSAIIKSKGKTFCFYNGNNFGEYGFGVAELIE